MRIFAAIDILDQRTVRLAQGDFERLKVYGEDPSDTAMRLCDMGATSLHIVDLNAAKEGIGRNLKIIASICAKTKLFVQAGGGVRSKEAASALFEAGANRIVIGTKALEDPGFVESLSHDYPNQIAVGLDVMDGFAMAHGWRESSGIRVEEAFRTFNEMPIASIVLTDISKDGMLEGLDASFYKSLIPLTDHEITASGGITSINDLLQLREHGVKSAIVGKAIYEGKIDISLAMSALG